MKKLILFFACFLFVQHLAGQKRYELNQGWQSANVKEVSSSGFEISKTNYALTNWLPATVPGTVLTTLLNNKKVPDPFYGMNNKLIKDVYYTGPEKYTYWFVKNFDEKVNAGEQLWLKLRGVNYKCEIYLNGQKVNAKTHEGMHLRQQYNITALLAANGKNRLAILVYPPTHPGNPNGGQGGDGTIAKDLTTQYTAGWDWTQAIPDRNTGIWDKVEIEKTKGVNLENPHLITIVPGVRKPDGPQNPAIIKVSGELENPTLNPVTGYLQYYIGKNLIKQPVKLNPKEKKTVKLQDFQLNDPLLWWPNGYGKQNLYDVNLQFVNQLGQVLDEEKIQFGIREISTAWNSKTQSRESYVNGQKIFIKGGNWIISDGMLRFSDARYDAEVRFHRDMNLNLIRIWGGAIIERPEFYKACDKYGLLVFQDFWFSGDANGKWEDPLKKDDQWTRRQYPDNHNLVLEAMSDQIKMIRNHPSLAFWCGGNEITPPQDILIPLKNKILPELDGTRYFYDYSNTNDMSYNFIGGNGDGPYTIQDPKSFWANRTYPFNSEVGSVGVGDYASLIKFIPEKNRIAPQPNAEPDSVWAYHRYMPYDDYIEPYGKAKDVADFAMKAQIVNFNQYRALMEGFSSHMWDWYTGTIIWKTQNPWTSLRGQMYDYYLDVNACLYGLKKGAEPLHIMMSPVDSMVYVVNQSFEVARDLMIQVNLYDGNGKLVKQQQVFSEVGPLVAQKIFKLTEALNKLDNKDGLFVVLKILDQNKVLLSENQYWLPNNKGDFSGIQKLKKVALNVSQQKTGKGKLRLTLKNDLSTSVAFFNRIGIVNLKTEERILPTFFSDNYFSLFPGDEKNIEVEFLETDDSPLAIEIYGWNVNRKIIPLSIK